MTFTKSVQVGIRKQEESGIRHLSNLRQNSQRAKKDPGDLLDPILVMDRLVSSTVLRLRLGRRDLPSPSRDN